VGTPLYLDSASDAGLVFNSVESCHCICVCILLGYVSFSFFFSFLEEALKCAFFRRDAFSAEHFARRIFRVLEGIKNLDCFVHFQAAVFTFISPFHN